MVQSSPATATFSIGGLLICLILVSYPLRRVTVQARSANCADRRDSVIVKRFADVHTGLVPTYGLTIVGQDIDVKRMFES